MLVNEIIFSLDYNKKGGINLNEYILLKKIIIGFSQYHVLGYLERDTFYSALKLSFVDYLLDELDSEIAYKIAMNLMLHDGTYRIYFPVYFEICRLVNTYFAFGVTIGEGFITKDQILRNYEDIVYPSKLNSQFLKKYFSIYDEDANDSSNANADASSEVNPNTYEENSLRFEDLANLEFWANIFTNYTSNYNLNVTGFRNLMKENKYIDPAFLNYTGYSNFEDLSNIKIDNDPSSNITEIDFLNGFHISFLETKSEINLKKKNLNRKINNFYKLDSKEKLKSLFELNLEDQLENDSNQQNGGLSEKQITDALTNYFKILDKNNNGNLNFDEFITFIKYLKVFQKLNKENDDVRGVISSDKINLINQIVINPKMTIKEKTRLQTFDTLPCSYVDFLLFFDFMYAPKIFHLYLINPGENFVEEINILIAMKFMNLYSEINAKKFQGIPNTSSVKFDYEPILNVGLQNKCKTNQIIFSKNKPAGNKKKNGIPDPLSDSVINGGGMDMAMN